MSYAGESSYHQYVRCPQTGDLANISSIANGLAELTDRTSYLNTISPRKWGRVATRAALVEDVNGVGDTNSSDGLWSICGSSTDEDSEICEKVGTDRWFRVDSGEFGGGASRKIHTASGTISYIQYLYGAGVWEDTSIVLAGYHNLFESWAALHSSHQYPRLECTVIFNAYPTGTAETAGFRITFTYGASEAPGREHSIYLPANTERSICLTDSYTYPAVTDVVISAKVQCNVVTGANLVGIQDYWSMRLMLAKDT